MVVDVNGDGDVLDSHRYSLVNIATKALEQIHAARAKRLPTEHVAVAVAVHVHVHVDDEAYTHARAG